MEVVDVVELGLGKLEELLVVVDEEDDTLAGGCLCAALYKVGRRHLAVECRQRKLALGVQLVAVVDVGLGFLLRML